MRAAALLVSTGLVASLTASAAPASAAPDPNAPPPVLHRKSHDIAKALSGIGAGASTALVLVSFVATDPHNPYNVPLFYTGLSTSIVTPSLGEYYAGEYLTYGEALRAGAAGLAIVGVNLTKNTNCLGQTDDNSCKEISTGGIAVLGLGLLAYVGGVFYDVLDAPDAVDRYNYKLRMNLSPGPMLSPTGGPPGGGVWLRGSW